MNPQARMVGALCRIAAATSTLRVRADDVARREQNGGDGAELRLRVVALIEQLERVADELEAALR